MLSDSRGSTKSANRGAGNTLGRLRFNRVQFGPPPQPAHPQPQTVEHPATPEPERAEKQAAEHVSTPSGSQR
jgi:hypothetical protein